MSWMQFGSVAYELGSRSAPGVHPKDIAMSLAKINRYNGHTKASSTLSVARHSVYVSKLLDVNPKAALYGLVHDVPECVTGDLSYPMKKKLGPAFMEAFKEISDAAEEALFKVLRVPYPMPPEVARMVKVADWVAAATEKRDVMAECDRTWDMLPYPPSHVKAHATVLPSADFVLWIERYMALANYHNLWT